MFSKLIAILTLFSIVAGGSSIREEDDKTSSKNRREDNGKKPCISECPPSFISINQGCYHFSPTRTNWFEASQFCRSMNAFLVSVETKEENEALVQYKGFTNQSLWWTSGNDFALSRTFVWASTGQIVTYTKWCPNEPNNVAEAEHCIHYANGCWNDIDCKWKFPFICEKLM